MVGIVRYEESVTIYGNIVGTLQLSNSNLSNKGTIFFKDFNSSIAPISYVYQSICVRSYAMWTLQLSLSSSFFTEGSDVLSLSVEDMDLVFGAVTDENVTSWRYCNAPKISMTVRKVKSLFVCSKFFYL